jgi:hypothetical protein
VPKAIDGWIDILFGDIATPGKIRLPTQHDVPLFPPQTLRLQKECVMIRAFVPL